MASTADIWNAALTHVGAAGRIVDPMTPDGSREAELCKMFYPLARRHLLESSTAWSFATKRVTLSRVENKSTEWQFAYGAPSDLVRVVRVVSPSQAGATLRNTDVFPTYTATLGYSSAVELVNNVPILYTDIPDAVLVYIADAADPGRFSPLFVTALGYTLASFIAGGLVKGTAGVRLARELREVAASFTADAATAQANGMQDQTMPATPMITSRY